MLNTKAKDPEIVKAVKRDVAAFAASLSKTPANLFEHHREHYLRDLRRRAETCYLLGEPDFAEAYVNAERDLMDVQPPKPAETSESAP